MSTQTTIVIVVLAVLVVGGLIAYLVFRNRTLSKRVREKDAAVSSLVLELDMIRSRDYNRNLTDDQARAKLLSAIDDTDDGTGIKP